ncbi:tetratricopeptide repeat protein 36 [Neodiprion lecontei]|uniref:Tetratricopeptide repeat protein 36 n=1 Tax=Neodiprion lecontei TaxID=441921 RepID=A0A6J0BM56_NEOLC|nr:tetratricopeptide repeat protein 36 [Neodiprion lecontei]
MHQLSEHDKAVLNSIFNPLTPLGEAVFSEETNIDEETQNSEEDVLIPEIAAIHRQAISETEKGNHDEARRLFAEALKKSPNSVTLLNDRAQCLRLAGLDEDAMKDLNLALKLSNGRGKAGNRALCQRGILLRKNGKLDEARRDFSEAAKGGSKFAKTQLVELNPYAAMCNQMLREMTVKLSNP